jgi:hypothetical protein
VKTPNGQGPAAKPSKKKKQKAGKKGKAVRFLVFLFISFIAVFATVYYSIERHVQAQAAVIEAKPDSTTVPVSAPVDSVEQKLEEMQRIEEDPDAKMNLVEQLYWLKERFAENESQMVDMYREVTEDRAKLSMEVRELRAENAQQAKDLKYYQETLPANIAEKLVQMEQQRIAQLRVQNGTSQGGAAAGSGSGAAADANPGIRALAKIYEAMRPNEAAPILSKMDVDKVVQILLRMRQRNAAKILSSFDSDYAARISRKLSGGQ